MIKPLTWDDLAALHLERTGLTIKTKPLHEAFEWAKNQPDIVEMPSGHLILEKK